MSISCAEGANRMISESTPSHPTPPLPDLEHPIKTLYCVHCGHPLKVRMSCGDRTCPSCRRKWFGYHFRTLLTMVENWRVIRSLTLTVKNIPDAEFSRYHVEEIRGYFTKLRKRFKEIEGGFYVVQATNMGQGWHLHLHIIFDGKYIPKQRVVNAWTEITGGSYIVDLANVRSPEKALRYLLADFSSKPRIRPEDYATYNGIFRGSRLVQPFGTYRKTKFRIPFKCPACGSTCWAFLEDIISDKWIDHGFKDDP